MYLNLKLDHSFIWEIPAYIALKMQFYIYSKYV